MELGGRKLSILKIIIDDYINTGQPVGSRTVSKKPAVGVSSATIRNEMADLEELGYLLQPHTSAGRIPSDIGYRLYVDLISENIGLNAEEKKLVKSLLFVKGHQLEDLIDYALKILTDMTGLTTIISLPLFKKSKLQNMKLIKVNDNKVLLIMISDTGVIKNISLPISGAGQEQLDSIASAMLSRFKDTTIENISVKEVYKMRDELKECAEFVDYLIPILRDSLRELSDYEIYVGGKSKIFEINEFSDIRKARDFLDLISDKNLLFSVLESASDEVLVKIGAENKDGKFKDLSVVVSPYKFNGFNDGRVAVIGPTRMDYERVIPSVKFTANTLSNLFSGIDL